MAAQRSQPDAEREGTLGPALPTLNMIRGQGLTETRTRCSKLCPMLYQFFQLLQALLLCFSYEVKQYGRVNIV
mgnify:CR=1 FL=1